MPPRYEVIGVEGIREVRPGDGVADLILAAAEAQGTAIRADDLLVVGQKIVSKAEGRLVDLATVTPSPFAQRYAAMFDKDARQVEVVLGETKRIVRMEHGVMICETYHGFVCANAGVDASNVETTGIVCLLPLDSDASAKRIADAVERASGADVAVIISDTFGRPWREGHVNFGVAGVAPLRSYLGEHDPAGHTLQATILAVADELAGAAELVMGKLDRVPAVIIRGLGLPAGDEGSKPLLRDPSRDLFR